MDITDPAPNSLPAMLRFFAHDAHDLISRREWLRIGGLASVGALASAIDVAAEKSGSPLGFGRAKSVLLVYASGGQSQLDMWDPKPQAPDHVRGEFSTIATAVPGQAFCEHMPRIAKIADRFTVVRTMSHRDLDHGSATYLALTGRYHQRISSNPPPRPTDFPSYASVLKRIGPPRPALFDAVHVNGPALVPFYEGPGQNGGFLGREYEPLVVGDVNAEAVAIPGLGSRHDIPRGRLAGRRSLKDSLDNLAAELSSIQPARDMSHLYGEALGMLESPRCRDAFDLSREPDSVRDRYGRNRSGQACLLARRLVEAGVPFINVIWNHSNRGQDRSPDETDWYGWDTHNDIFHALKNHLIPRFDVSFSALIEDLDERGLLDETLVVCMGEFGRAPLVALEKNFAGSTPGRKHWASVYSLVMAGAGVERGGVLGQSDRLGAEPITERYGPWDVTATMYSALGIDPAKHFTDALDRPFPITIGKPIEGIYGA